MRRVRNGELKIRTNDIPLFMYDPDELDPHDRKAGLLLSPLLFSVRGPDGLSMRRHCTDQNL